MTSDTLKILEKIRSEYLTAFLIECDQLSPELGLIIEPELKDEETPDNFWKLPYRIDAALVENGELGNGMMIDSENSGNFSPFEDNSLPIPVTINPFPWNGCQFLVQPALKNPDWQHLKDFYLRNFKEHPTNNSPFMNCLHYLDEPRKREDGWHFSIDFGSAPTSTFKELVTAVAKAGFEKIIIGLPYCEDKGSSCSKGFDCGCK